MVPNPCARCLKPLDPCLNAINAFGPLDKSRRTALRVQGVFHLVSFILAIFAVLGLTQAGLADYPWGQYKVNATAFFEIQNKSMLRHLEPDTELDVHINIWGVCSYLTGSASAALGSSSTCSSWGDHTTAFARVAECADASQGLFINVIIAVLSQLVQLAKVRKRFDRNSDRGVKIFNICTCLLPLVLMDSAALGFRGACIKTDQLPTAALEKAAGIGFVCFVLSFCLNLPAAIIQLLIPTAPPDDAKAKAAGHGGSAGAQPGAKGPGAATPLLTGRAAPSYRGGGAAEPMPAATPGVEPLPPALSAQIQLDDALRHAEPNARTDEVTTMASFLADANATPATVAV